MATNLVLVCRVSITCIINVKLSLVLMDDNCLLFSLSNLSERICKYLGPYIFRMDLILQSQWWIASPIHYYPLRALSIM